MSSSFGDRPVLSSKIERMISRRGKNGDSIVVKRGGRPFDASRAVNISLRSALLSYGSLPVASSPSSKQFDLFIIPTNWRTARTSCSLIAVSNLLVSFLVIFMAWRIESEVMVECKRSEFDRFVFWLPPLHSTASESLRNRF